jgi:osmotically-inducible protein OsmY
VEDGVVYLRGEASAQEMVDDLESKARDVQGVRDVVSFLHLPNAQPQMKQ